MEKKSILLLVISIIVLAVAVVFAVWSFNLDAQNVSQQELINQDEEQDLNSENLENIENENTENEVASEYAEFSENDYKEQSKTKTLEATYLDFTVKDLSGNEIKLSDYKDSPVMVLFWNSENEDSIEMLKRLNEQYKNYENEINFIVINTGEKYTVEGITLKMYQDTNKEVSKLYKITEYPAMLYINKENEVFNAKVGLTTKDALKANLDILAENF